MKRFSKVANRMVVSSIVNTPCSFVVIALSNHMAFAIMLRARLGVSSHAFVVVGRSKFVSLKNVSWTGSETPSVRYE